MNRRAILLTAVAGIATARVASAQEKVWRLGVLTPGIAGSGPASVRAATLPVLAERGFVEHRNLVVITRGAEGDVGQLPSLAREIATERADVVIAVGMLATNAMQAASPATSIVMSFAGDAPIFSPLAAGHGMATICEWDYMAHQRCIIGSGPDLLALRRRTGDFVARILKGGDPGEMPIERPDRFTLAVNLRAAAALGLELPPTFLARADEVIE
jgi:ABC-type uncharacterized transport system substrate-binding protein